VYYLCVWGKEVCFTRTVLPVSAFSIRSFRQYAHELKSRAAIPLQHKRARISTPHNNEQQHLRCIVAVYSVSDMCVHTTHRDGCHLHRRIITAFRMFHGILEVSTMATGTRLFRIARQHCSSWCVCVCVCVCVCRRKRRNSLKCVKAGVMCVFVCLR